MTFELIETTIEKIQHAFHSGELTSKQLVMMYMERIAQYDQSGPMINSVLELNPDALFIAEAMDLERKYGECRGPLHGIPILIKDNINTRDKMHTSAGSLALADSFAPDDAVLVQKLRKAGAVILGKTNLTEWANFMTEGMPSGYSSRGGQVLNPYNSEWTPSGSSSGSGAAVASNFCAAAIGTETAGSIMSPCYMNSLVGIKPTVGLISRRGIIPISSSQDTAGPMTRTVTDAAILLGTLTGRDDYDPATWTSRGKTHSDYTVFLDQDGLQGARIGVNRAYMKDFDEDEKSIFEQAIETLKKSGATVIENTDIPHVIEDLTVLVHEFKLNMNAYLASLGPASPVKTLRDIVAFNEQHADQTLKYGQTLLKQAEYETRGTFSEPVYLHGRLRDLQVSQTEGIDRVIDEHQLDTLFCPGVTDLAAVAGYPSIQVPAGYTKEGKPVGVTFIHKAYQEEQLLKIAFAFEQATQVRKPPMLNN